ncbi:MAG: hypothetical protein HN742_40245 [Lentisphaerae bacterium]|jgi:hypothetical protein|nr:hypothetical protein [Lentisphaerota bacterium]MBT5606968.1 hypothetical protein [Lentisphaerota bacterium]MBT7056997.1 hypothetical protein [Lentisphaerota bacterium]MBT7848167.1 hypothetical protein [Lentisphaerota bacterium]
MRTVAPLCPSMDVFVTCTGVRVVLVVAIVGLTGGPLLAGNAKSTAAAYRDVRSAAQRQVRLSRFGGSDATEAAVLHALRWLGSRQNAAGTWTESQPDAMGALALLAFLGHGETLQSEEFGPNVKRSMDYLIDRMDQTPTESAAGCGGRAYVNGIVTYALGEATWMTSSERAARATEKGLAFIIRGQHERDGGWDYRYAKGKRWDLSVSGWQIQALHAAHVAGVAAPALEDALVRAVSFVRDVTFRKGKFGYSSPGSGSWAMQGAGAYCLQLLGGGKGAEATAALRNISDNDRIVWDEERKYRGHTNISYNWYYETQAIFQAGGEMWRKWNKAMAETLIDHQQPDGHWDHPGSNAEAPEYTPVYTTALCCLCLEAYYRYPPAGEAN